MGTLSYSDFEALPEMVTDLAMDLDAEEPSVEEIHGAIKFIEAMQQSLRQLLIVTDQQMMRRAEKRPVTTTDGRVYAVEKDFKDRPQSAKIDAHIVQHLQAEYGMEETPAWKVATLMRLLWAAPAQIPKVGGLQRIGLHKNDATSREFVKNKLVIADYGPPREDDE